MLSQLLSVAVLLVNAQTAPSSGSASGPGAASYAGQSSHDGYLTASEPASLFPAESIVGYAGATPTGAEPFAIQTASPRSFQNYPKVDENFYPLFRPVASDGNSSFNPMIHWGNLGPRYSVDPNFYNLSSASPVVPSGCAIDQVQIVMRHGSRYPSSGERPGILAVQIQNATKAGTFSASGPLSFLNEWEYLLGQDILNPFGRQQCYQLGIASRMQYGGLLNNFTNSLPVIRTGSQDRMVNTAIEFARGFFGAEPSSELYIPVKI